ncbi:MAG TPA: hypothetical protein VEW04_03240 [Allosphingosinicella sp.]|nr:hypothetical protein [Allosphingosinicella sp.]
MNELVDYHRMPLDEYATRLANLQSELAAAVGAPNYPIDTVRLGDPAYPHHQLVPCSIYFYYIRINTDGKLYVTHYFYPGGDPNDPNNPANPADWPAIPRDRLALENILRDLALNARQNGANPPPIGTRFEDISWRRKSYLAFFIDELNWKLHKLANGDPCIVFITEPKDGKIGMENHTFFDAMDLDVAMPINGGSATDLRSAVVFIDHMKADDAGNDLGAGGGQFFQFKMYFDVAFAGGGTGMTVIFDPGGTNQGPSVPPPPS